MDFPRDCATAAELRTLGWELAEGLSAGQAVGLCGELGAGKTELVKGLAAGLGFLEPVTSPTFTLLHEYRGGRLPLFHYDFYRIEHADELIDLGWDDLLEEGVVVAEWADRFPDLLPGGSRWLTLEILPDGGRRISERPWSGHQSL